MWLKLSHLAQSVLLTGTLVGTAIAQPGPTLTTATAPVNPAPVNIAQGCEALGGTYHDLSADRWVCLYQTPNHAETLGISCNVARTCDRLIYTRRHDGTASLLWEPVIPAEQTDD